MYRMKQCVVSNQTSSSTNLSKHEPCQVQLEVAFDVKATWKLSLRCKSRKITTHNDFSNNDGLNAIHTSLTSSPFLTLTGFWRRSSQRPGRIMFSPFCTWRVWQGTTKALEEMLDQDKVANAFLDVIFDRELNFWDDLKMHISTGCTLRASPASASAALSCQRDKLKQFYNLTSYWTTNWSANTAFSILWQGISSSIRPWLSSRLKKDCKLSYWGLPESVSMNSHLAM